MKGFASILLFIAVSITAYGSGYEIGDKAVDFKLKNVDGQMVSMSDYKDAKGFIVIFTCNHCPYSKAYEDRIIDLQKRYSSQGYPVLAINPNDPARFPEDSYDGMKKRANKKKFNFPYLLDDTQEIAKAFGATRTPHVFLLDKELTVQYIGAIDDNSRNPSAVNLKYVETALSSMMKGEKPDPNLTKAVGCSIKWKQ